MVSILAYLVMLFSASIGNAAAVEVSPASRGIDVQQIATGRRHSCAILDGGSLFCWGDNSVGQCGSGTGEKSYLGISSAALSQFAQVDLGTGRTAKQVATGSEHTCVLLDNDKIKWFGANGFGNLGIGDTTNRGTNTNDMGDNLPYVDMGPGRWVKQVSTGSSHTCVLLDNNQVKCFGSNYAGQLGLGDDINRGGRKGDMGRNLPFVNIGKGRTVKAVTAGLSHTCVLLDNDRIKCFGDNQSGELGLGDRKSRGKLARNMGDNLPYVNLGTNRTAKQISAGGSHTCVLLDNNQVKCIGSNSEGEARLGGIVNRGTGIGEMSDKLPYVQVGRGRTVQQVTAGGLRTCVLLDNQQIKCFGYNLYGHLGLGDTRDRGDGGNDMGDNLPFVNVGHNRKVKLIAAGYFHTCVLLDNHQVKCFGRNEYGQLGIGDQVNRGDISDEMGDNLMYVDLGLNKTAKHVAAGLYHTCVILDNDQVKCFGRNEFGQLGLGDRRSRGDGKNETGDNEYEEYEVTEEYEFGDNEFRVKKMQVTELGMSEMDVNKLGGNEMKVSELGENEVEADEMGDTLPFVNVGTNRTVKQVVAGDGHTCVLLDNKHIKCFGKNEFGQLGHGDRLNRGDDPNDMGDNLPYVDVGQERTVEQIAAGSSHTCVLLDNNQVKCFGYNASGQLGIGDQLHGGDEPDEMGGQSSLRRCWS